MNIQRYESNHRISEVVAAGDILYLSGQACGEGDIKNQTAQVLKRIEELLEANGSDKDHLLRVEIFLSDVRDFTDMNELYDAWLADSPKPARACMVTDLVQESFRLEVVVTAAKKE